MTSQLDIPYKYYFFGSENSSDTDVLIEVEEIKEPHKVDAFIKEFKKTFNLDWDISLIVIKDGKIVDTNSRKGSPDNVNNSLFNTYLFHDQKFPCPISAPVDRNHLLAIFKCVRNILSFCSRTEFRKTIKTVLKTEYYNSEVLSFKDFLDVLKKIDFNQIDNFNKNYDDKDIFKKIAFFLGQTLCLIKHDMEIYTKNQLIEYYPDLTPFMERDIENMKKELLNELKNELISIVTNYDVQFIGERKLAWNNEIIDVQSEKVIKNE